MFVVGRDVRAAAKLFQRFLSSVWVDKMLVLHTTISILYTHMAHILSPIEFNVIVAVVFGSACLFISFNLIGVKPTTNQMQNKTSHMYLIS